MFNLDKSKFCSYMVFYFTIKLMKFINMLVNRMKNDDFLLQKHELSTFLNIRLPRYKSSIILSISLLFLSSLFTINNKLVYTIILFLTYGALHLLKLLNVGKIKKFITKKYVITVKSLYLAKVIQL